MNPQQVQHRRKRFRIVAGEIGETLQGGRFHNGRAVLEECVEGGGGAACLRHREFQPGDDEGEIPAQLDEAGIGEQAQQGFRVLIQNAGQRRRGAGGYALQNVGGPASHAGIVVPHEFDDPPQAAGLSGYLPGKLCDSSGVECVVSDGKFGAEIEAARHIFAPILL